MRMGGRMMMMITAGMGRGVVGLREGEWGRYLDGSREVLCPSS